MPRAEIGNQEFECGLLLETYTDRLHRRCKFWIPFRVDRHTGKPTGLAGMLMQPWNPWGDQAPELLT